MQFDVKPFLDMAENLMMKSAENQKIEVEINTLGLEKVIERTLERMEQGNDTKWGKAIDTMRKTLNEERERKSNEINFRKRVNLQCVSKTMSHDYKPYKEGKEISTQVGSGKTFNVSSWTQTNMQYRRDI